MRSYAFAAWHIRSRQGCIALPDSKSTGDVGEIGLDDDDVAAVMEFAVVLWTERSEVDDERLKDRQACASKLTAFR